MSQNQTMPGSHTHTHTRKDGLKTHEDGLKIHKDGLDIQTIREHFVNIEGTILWVEAPQPKAAHLVGTPAGYQAVTKVHGREYKGNVFINFRGTRITAQEVAWVLHYGEFAADHLRIIHLDGDKTNQDPANLHIQPKPGFPDPKIES